MSDLISRQAVIDAFGLSEKTRKYGGDHSGYDTRMLYEIQDVIEGMPSAEPEIIRCKDCKYASPNGKYGCKAYHFKLYETHEMKADDFCSRAERRTNG